MEEYLRGFLNELPDKITETPETPSVPNLFKVSDYNKRELLEETRAQAFHHAVAQLLFTRVQCRKESQTVVAFLTTIARKPDEDDWKKLKRLLGYLKQTIKLPLIPCANR